MDQGKLKKKVEGENNNRINITNVKYRNCFCLFNNYSKCYINIKKRYNLEISKYDKIYGNENIKINEERITDGNKESSLEFTYPYRYDNNRNIFLIINSKNINLGNTCCIYNNDIIYIIYNNKKYEHVNIQKQKRREKKRKEKNIYSGKNDTYSSLTSCVTNEEEEENPIYNSTIFETSNMNFCITSENNNKKKKKEAKSKNKRNFIYSDEDSDNNYEHIFTHINSDLYFLSVSNDHIENEKNFYIQNEKYINYNDIIFRKLKFKKKLFMNLDTYNSWIVIKKSILLNEYISRLVKNDLVDINDVLYDVANTCGRIANCYTRIYINDSFLLINNKTKEILGVQMVKMSNHGRSSNNSGGNSGINSGGNSGRNSGINSGGNSGRNSGGNSGINSGGNSGGNSGRNSGGNSGINSGGNSGINSGCYNIGNTNSKGSNNVLHGGETNPSRNDDPFFFACTGNEESNCYKLVLIKKMNVKYLFNSDTDINITFSFHDVCLTSYNSLDQNNSYLLINNYTIHRDSKILLNFAFNKNNTGNYINNNYSENVKENKWLDPILMKNEDYIYFNNYITHKIIENYVSYSSYIKECLLIIDILYILNNSYGNIIYIKEYYKYDHENYYSSVCNILKKNKNYQEIKTNSKDNTSICSLSSYSENEDETMSTTTNSKFDSSVASDECTQDSSNSNNLNNDGDNRNKQNNRNNRNNRKSCNKNGYHCSSANLTDSEKQLLNELNDDLIYLMPKYKLVFHPHIFNTKESNNSNIEIVKDILKLGIYIRRIQKFVDINKRGQSCNFTFDIFCCCLYNISLHILNHINRIEENIRNIFNFTKINMNDNKNDLSLCLFDENRLSTCTDPEEKKIFFSINNLFHKNVQDFNLFFNINIEKADDISLYKIKISILPLLQIAKLLNKIINKIISKKKINNSKYLIDLIYKLQEYLNSDDINKTVLLYLLKNITTPLFDFIKNYIFYGKVKDTYKEFFIHENKHITPYYKQNNKFYYNNIYKYIFKKYFDLSTNYWGAKYIILNNKVPIFLKNISNHIFITGKYIDVLFTCSKFLNLQNSQFSYLHQNSFKNYYNSVDMGVHNSSLILKDKGNNTYEGTDSIHYNNNQDQNYQMLNGITKRNNNYYYNKGRNKMEEYEYYNHMNIQNSKTCYLIFDNNKKIYEDLIHNQHLFASKKMFELYIKKIDIKEKIKHHYFFFFLQISDYLKYFYILAHEHLEKLYNNKKNNIFNKLKNYFDISIRSSVLYNLKYRKDYNVDVSDILSIIDNVNLIIDLKHFHVNNGQFSFNKRIGPYGQEQKHAYELEGTEHNVDAYFGWNHSEEKSNGYTDESDSTDNQDIRKKQNYSDDEANRQKYLNNKNDSKYGSELDSKHGIQYNSEYDSEHDNKQDKESKKRTVKNKKMRNYSKSHEMKKRQTEKGKGRGTRKKSFSNNLKNNMLNNIHNNLKVNINVEIYKGLILSYHNMFPYNLIFNNITIFKYTLIFRILNYCKYIEHKLTEVWLNHMFVKNIEINEECKNNLMICIHTRECMIHFLKCYLYHIQNDVIKSEYNYMNSKLKETLIFDDIIYIHNNYLNNILKYSFIMNQSIINCVLKLISIAHIFTRHILKFSFCKNEQIENLSSHDNLKSATFDRNVASKKKNNKSNYHKKFIQELLRDKAYISMIHNTIKHYDKHFKNFFLLLTEYVNNNIDDYAHNFLIKLDYNFYYTNKYKIDFEDPSHNEADPQYRNESNSSYTVNYNVNTLEANELNINRKKNLITTPSGMNSGAHSGIVNPRNYHIEPNEPLEYTDKFNDANNQPNNSHANYNTQSYANPRGNNATILSDIKNISNAGGFSQNVNYKNSNESNFSYYANSTTNSNNFINGIPNSIPNNNNITYSPISLQRNNYTRSPLNDTDNSLNNNNFVTFHQNNNSNVLFNNNNNEHEQDINNYNNKLSNIPNNNMSYSKLKKYSINNNNENINNINISNIDINSIDNSIYNSKFNH
ncbi:spindle pole body protein [Plasmodium brasilianum]|uniref:Spindle pole body protein n=1 Tax=Plasmodium brasilianum TaxID=5824 RepID=A0ACB9YD73_PLABR|nr:spindle pole body protein [Plasmodium brasilianum]